jgi:hypothetical protein
MEFYRAMIAEEKDNLFTPVLDDPAKAGVDLRSKLFFATEYDENDPEISFTYTLIPLKSEGDFTEALSKGTATVKTKSGLNWVENDGRTMLAWKGNLAVFCSGTEHPEDRIVQLFKRKKEESIASNYDLRKALTGKNDIEAWFSLDAAAENSGAGFALDMLDVTEDALQGNAVHGFANFEKGKIVGHGDFFINRKLGEDFLGKFFRKKTDADFSNVLPQEDLAFAATLALDPVGIERFLEEQPETKSYADFVLKSNGLKMSDLTEALNGDVLVAGFGKTNPEDGSLLLAFKVRSNSKAQSIIGAAVEKKQLREVEKGFYAVNGSFNTEVFSFNFNKNTGYILQKGDLLCFSTNEALVQKIKSGDFEKAGSEITKVIDNQAFNTWLSFEATKSSLDFPDQLFFRDLSLIVSGKGADLRMNTGNESKNSLQSIFEQLNEAYKSEKKWGRKEM